MLRLVLLVPLLQDSRPAPRPPNILHIVADDVGWDDVGCYGGQDIPTPHLDRLAREGLRLTSYYAPHPTCTPTRAALLTGCYAPRVGLPQVLFPTDQVGLAPDETTIAELLRGRGYATALIGKWHLGHHPEHLPTRHGFDLFFGIPYPNDHGPERLDRNGRSRGFPPVPLLRQEAVVETPAQLGSLPLRLEAEAVRFLEAHRGQPFYLHFANIETHTPWLVPRRAQGQSRAGVYGDAVHCLDQTVGVLLATLDRLGLSTQTLVVFSSDNGPLVDAYPELEGIYGHAATVDTTRRHALRGGKYQARYEGGTRVSCLVRWPGHIAAGAVCDQIVAGFDWFATFAAIAGAAVPTDRARDGRDLTPLLTGASTAPVHEQFLYYENRNLVAVRAGGWKLVFPPRNQPVELYDLESDRGETRNCATERPDVVQDLLARARRGRTDLGEAASGTAGAGTRPAHRVR